MWRDLNNNALLDVGETGIDNAPVELLDTGGNVIGTINSDSNGDYQFVNLAAGDYRVRVTTNLNSSTATDLTPNDNIDNDDNGMAGTGADAYKVVSNVITLASGIEPTINQANGKTINSTVDYGLNSIPTAVKMREFRAFEKEGHTVLTWQTGYEINNLGFRVYRQTDGGQELLNPEIIAGSALAIGVNEPLSAGNSYVWHNQTQVLNKTAEKSNSNNGYFLEAIDLDGTSEFFGPIFAEIASDNFSGENSLTVEQISNRRQNAQSNRPVIFDSAAQSKLTNEEPNTEHKESRTKDEKQIKIEVARDGWYRVSRKHLTAAGFDTLSDAANWRLFADGREQAFKINAKGGIEFYGRALDTAQTDTRIYWLRAGKVAGKRITTETAGFDVSAQTGWFLNVAERRDRNIRVTAILNGGESNFYGGVVTASRLSKTLSLDEIAAESNETATVEIALQGLSWGANTVEVLLNSNSLGFIELSGRERKTFRAGQNKLVAEIPANANIKLSGFTSPQIRVLDVTDETETHELILNGVAETDGFSFSMPVSAAARAIIAEDTDNLTGLTPKNVTLDVFSDLKNTNNAADFLIIAPREFETALEPLRQKRQKEGLATRIVDINDIYDEFNDGARSADAIQKFLALAHKNWRHAPQFVLLVGDASVDPRGFTGDGVAFDQVPTMMVDTTWQETAADNALVDFGRGWGEMAIGRLPVKNVDEVQIVVAKILGSENALPTDKPRRGALFVSGLPIGLDFAALSENIIKTLPSNVKVERIERAADNAEAVRAQIISKINAGARIVNFYGHGSLNAWTSAGILRSADVAQLNNRSALSLVTMLTCLNGAFAETGGESFAETMLKAPNGGAFAVLANTATSKGDGQDTLATEFYREILAGERVGTALKNSKIKIADRDAHQTLILFGDPTSKLAKR